MTSLLRVASAVLRKDLRCAFPAVLLAVAVFGGDVIVMRLELWPIWESLRQPLVLLSAALLVFAVFQLDSPVSLVDDWLCRPVPRHALLLAKGGLVLAVVYGSRVIATLAVDLAGRRPVGETLADALLIQDEFFLLVLAILWLIAITTRTTIQAIGALIGVFIALLLLPTALMPSVGPLEPGVGESLMENGMAWMATAPAKAFAVLATALCCVLVYSLRQTAAARAWVGVSALIALALFVVPMGYLPWPTLAATQAAAIPDPPEGSPGFGRISLLPRRACFPATRLSSVADGAFGALRQAARLRWWTDEELRGAGPQSLAFVTSLQPRGLPRDWRAELLFVQAEYRGAEGRERVALRPTHYESAGDFTHAWLLPDAALERLQGAGAPAATFRYSFAVLQPRKHRVPLDGQRHRLEGLGWCGAQRIASSNGIEVECLVTASHVTQVSAELPSIGASADFGPVDYSPAWLRAVRARRIDLTISSARLSSEDGIDVIAWTPAGLVERTWQAAGMLGADAATCPLPDPHAPERLPASRWRDTASHQTQLVAVEAGVSLEVLDFGGKGPPLLLVPGLGATAHTFDTLGPRLAERHRVFALTRRGVGASSRVDFGYDTARLGRDILAVLDALGLPKATLVGSSIAGDELTWLGGHHPERVAAVVYLDAAFDRSAREPDRRLHELQLLLPPEPPLREQDLLDYAAFRARQAWRRGAVLPEGELIAFHQAGKAFLAGIPDIDPRVAAAIPAALQRPDYRALKVPALAMYATLDETAPLRPWFDPDDPQQRRALREIAAITEAAKRASIEQLRAEAPDVKIIEIRGADHAIFLSHEREVVEAIEQFVATRTRD